METENKTGSFYGDLVLAAMDKDVKRMAELIDALSNEEVAFLASALMDIAMMSSAIKKIKGS